MNKKIKVLIITLVCAGVIAATVLILHKVKINNREKKTVDVYPVEDIAYDPSIWGDSETISGNVVVNNEQKIYVSGQSRISEICVSEGDKVKAGDVLMIYDMTQQKLQLDIERTELEISRAGVEDAKNELQKLLETEPVEPTTEAPSTTETPTTEEPTTETPPTSEEKPTEEPTSEEKPTEEPTSEEKPTEEPTSEEKPTEEPTSEEKPTEEPTSEEKPTEEPTTETPTTEAATEAPTTEAPTTEAPPEDDEIEDFEDDGDFEITYTKEELEEAIRDKQAEIRSLEIEYQLDYVAFQILELEAESGEVYANFDGEVTYVGSADASAGSDEPVITVSGDNAYVVETSIGELSLAKYKTGTECSLYCYDNGTNYSGKLTEISEYPTEDEYGYSSKVESYYPVKIAITDCPEPLSRGMYMEITMGDSGDIPEEDEITDETEDAEEEENAETSSSSSSLCLLQAFILREGNNYYVMKEVDGRIKKVYIKTGKIMSGGYMIEVTEGLSRNDFIAFPYSSSAEEGIHTVHKSVDELTGY